jgi:four helix bundle protein
MNNVDKDKIDSFTKLVAWQISHKFVLLVLKNCEQLSYHDPVRNQMERAAISITSNIAEGFGRQSIADKKHFYVMARGSAYELQNQLLISRDTSRMNDEQFKELAQLSLDSVRLLHGLIRSTNRTKDAIS